MQLLHARHSGLLGRLSCNRTIYHVNRAHGSGPHVGSTISSCAVLQEQSYLRTSGTTYTKSLPIRHDPHRSYLATTMLQKDQQNVRLISTHATEESVEQPPQNKRVDRLPEVHHVWVKNTGKVYEWESVMAIFTQQPARNDREGRACQRRLWISYDGSEPTEEELALGWPQDKQKAVRRKVWDKKEHQRYAVPQEFTVTEKIGENGRRFWRETTKRLVDENQGS